MFGEEYSFSLSSGHPIRFKPHHWQHPEGNSAIDINGIEIDVFQWQVAAEERKTVKVDLVSPIWEYAGWITDNIVLPEMIEISKVSIFRGTPTIYIKVTPWRNTENGVEVLTGGKIRIWVAPTNFTFTLNHPHFLNREMNMLQRTSTDETQYLIICPSEFASAAQSLAQMHSNDVNMVGIEQLNTEVVLTNSISTNLTGTELRNYIIQRIDEDYNVDEIVDFKRGDHRARGNLKRLRQK